MREASLFNRDFLRLCIGSLAFSSSFQLLLTTLPLYIVQMGARESQIGLVIGIFAASSFVVRPATGWQLDRGRRVPILALGAAVFALSAVGYALAASVTALLALRVFNGTGMAAYTTAAQTLVADLSPVKRRGEAMSVYSISTTVAQGLAPAIGMAIVLSSGFPPLFGVSFALASIALVMAAWLKEPRRDPSREAKPRLFNTSAVRPGVTILALMFTYGAVASFLPLYAVRQELSNPGFFFTVTSGSMFIAQLVAGRFSDRFGRTAVIVPGLALAAAGTAIISSLSGWGLMGAAALYGFGSGATQPALFAMATDGAKDAERGSAIATVGMFLEIGISGGAIVAGVLAESVGMGAMFVVVAALPLLGIVNALAPSIALGSRRTERLA